MKALISPNEKVSYISDWFWGKVNTPDGQEIFSWMPIFSLINGGQRIAEVELNDKTFEIAEPLFWVDCPDDCVADQWYYNDGACFPIPNAPIPENVPQPE